MSHVLLLVRIVDRPGALERVLGVIRRRVLAVRRLSVAAGDTALEVALRVDETRTAPERLQAELSSLVDVLDVADGFGYRTRELAVVQLRSGAPPPAIDGWRALASGSDGPLGEFTGSPEDVDAALAQLRAAGQLSRATRSGEVAIPIRNAEVGTAE